jgi:hypothetical protein
MRTSSLLSACEGAIDAPGNWQKLLGTVNKALDVLWADLLYGVPVDGQREQCEDLHYAITRAWNVIRPLGKDRESDSFVSCSMASLARGVLDPAQDRWQRLHKSYDAWIRECDDDAGEVGTYLAMRFGLFAQTSVQVTGIRSHKEFAAKCRELGLAMIVPTPSRLSGGGTVMVLGEELSCEILETEGNGNGET